MPEDIKGFKVSNHEYKADFGSLANNPVEMFHLTVYDGIIDQPAQTGSYVDLLDFAVGLFPTEYLKLFYDDNVQHEWVASVNDRVYNLKPRLHDYSTEQNLGEYIEESFSDDNNTVYLRFGCLNSHEGVDGRFPYISFGVKSSEISIDNFPVHLVIECKNNTQCGLSFIKSERVTVLPETAVEAIPVYHEFTPSYHLYDVPGVTENPFTYAGVLAEYIITLDGVEYDGCYCRVVTYNDGSATEVSCQAAPHVSAVCTPNHLQIELEIPDQTVTHTIKIERVIQNQISSSYLRNIFNYPVLVTYKDNDTNKFVTITNSLSDILTTVMGYVMAEQGMSHLSLSFIPEWTFSDIEEASDS